MQTYKDSAVYRNDQTDGITGKDDLNAAHGVFVKVEFSSGGDAVLFDVDDNPIANPLTTDNNGNYSFKCADGIYDIITNPGPDQVVERKIPIIDPVTTDVSGLVRSQPTLAAAVNESNPEHAYNELVIYIEERTTGNGGGALWKYELLSSVTLGQYAVACVGINTLALVRQGNSANIPSNQKKTYSSEKGRANNNGVISFIFDDAYESAHSTVAPLFEARNISCGFSVPFRLLNSAGFCTKSQIKDLYERGFEIGNHTLNNTILTTGSSLDAATGEAEIVGGYKELAAIGVDPKFFVAVSSSLDPKFEQYVPINHDLSFPRGTAGTGAAGVQDADLDRYNLKRESLFSIGVAGAKATIDYVAANGGYAQFYDHDPLQVGFPNSLSTAQITEILDYAVASGVLIATPSDALDYCSADLMKSRDVKINSINSKNTLISTDNLLPDSEFTSVGMSNGTLSPLTAWEVKNSGSGTVTPTRIGGTSGALQVAIGADTSAGDVITIENASFRLDVASAFWRNSNLCFAVDLTGVNNNFETNYTTKVGIEFRRTDNNAIIETKTINVDLFPFARTVYATLDTPVGIDFYVRAFFNVTVVTPLAVNLIAAKPVLSLTSTPAPYSSNPDFSSRVSKAPLAWRMDPTAIPNGVRTNIPITAGAIQNDIGRFDSGSFYAYQKGLYRVDIINIAASSGDTSNARTIVGLNLNGAVNHEFEGVGTGTRSVFNMSTAIELNPLDYIDTYIAQYSGVSVTTDGGATCVFRVTYLGQ